MFTGPPVLGTAGPSICRLVYLTKQRPCNSFRHLYCPNSALPLVADTLQVWDVSGAGFFGLRRYKVNHFNLV